MNLRLYDRILFFIATLATGVFLAGGLTYLVVMLEHRQ